MKLKKSGLLFCLQIFQDHVHIDIIFDQTPGFMDFITICLLDLGGHVLNGSGDGVGVLFRIKHRDTAVFKKTCDLMRPGSIPRSK